MRLNKLLYNGIVLDKLPVGLHRIQEDLIKPRDIKWFKDKHDGMVDFRMKTNDRIYHVRWVGEWGIEEQRFLKKLMLRWHYDAMGRLETKPWEDRYPFPVDYMKPIYVDNPPGATQ